MRVIIHGATNSSNFGDVLFAHLFYKKCKEIFADVDFLQMPKYGIGPFCREELNYHSKHGIANNFKADALVLMSGGYFGQNKVTFRRSVQFYFRYQLPTRIFQLLGKPIYILGVGGGPIITPFLRRKAVKILNQAKKVTVRDQETKDYFVQYGVKNDIEVTSDTAQVISNMALPEFEEEAELKKIFADKKMLFLHVAQSPTTDQKLTEKVIPAIMHFLEEHKDYGLLIGTDEVVNLDRIKNLMAVQKLGSFVKYIYRYHDSFQMASLLNHVDLVITTKLHVGIVSSALGKSVISFPAHREKTQRYYRQIGEEGRSLHIDEVTTEDALSMIEKYYQNPIILKQEIRDAAQRNLDCLEMIAR